MNFEKSQIWRNLTNEPGNYYCQASESEREEFKRWVHGLLNEREVTVDFVKADGDLRSMKCTLSEPLGAKYTMNEAKTPKKPNPEVCVVWDTGKNAWRSFRWDRLKRIEFYIG